MMKPLHQISLRVFADYNQFYVWDPEFCGQQAPEVWSEQDVVNRIKAAEGVVVICPLRNMEVPVEISVFDSAPDFLTSEWNHIAEAPLQIQSGVIEIEECTGGTLARITVAPGDYTLRALFRGLGTITEDGLDGKDQYLVQLWPAYCPKVSVIKQWES
jgi:hypothetical protein